MSYHAAVRQMVIDGQIDARQTERQSGHNQIVSKPALMVMEGRDSLWSEEGKEMETGKNIKMKNEKKDDENNGEATFDEDCVEGVVQQSVGTFEVSGTLPHSNSSCLYLWIKSFS